MITLKIIAGSFNSKDKTSVDRGDTSNYFTLVYLVVFSKIMILGREESVEMEVEGIKLEQVKRFEYFGVHI